MPCHSKTNNTTGLIFLELLERAYTAEALAENSLAHLSIPGGWLQVLWL